MENRPSAPTEQTLQTTAILQTKQATPTKVYTLPCGPTLVAENIPDLPEGWTVEGVATHLFGKCSWCNSDRCFRVTAKHRAGAHFSAPVCVLSQLLRGERV